MGNISLCKIVQNENNTYEQVWAINCSSQPRSQGKGPGNEVGQWQERRARTDNFISLFLCYFQLITSFRSPRFHDLFSGIYESKELNNTFHTIIHNAPKILCNRSQSSFSSPRYISQRRNILWLRRTPSSLLLYLQLPCHSWRRFRGPKELDLVSSSKHLPSQWKCHYSEIKVILFLVLLSISA